MKYYFLIAYLPEIQVDDKKIKYRLADLLDEKFHISENDWRDMELVLLAGDMLQIERLLFDKDTDI